MKSENGMSKVAAVTLGFWIIKIVATTLGETGGDAVSMTLNWGYALSSAMFISIFAVAWLLRLLQKPSTRFYIGPSSLLRRQQAPRWLISLTAPSASAIPADP